MAVVDLRSESRDALKVLQAGDTYIEADGSTWRILSVQTQDDGAVIVTSQPISE